MRTLAFAFNRIDFTSRPDMLGSNTVHIQIEVEGRSASIPDAEYTVPESRSIVLSLSAFGSVTSRVEIADDRTTPILVSIRVVDIDVFSSPTLGTIERRIN